MARGEDAILIHESIIQGHLAYKIVFVFNDWTPDTNSCHGSGCDSQLELSCIAFPLSLPDLFEGRLEAPAAVAIVRLSSETLGNT